MTGRLAGGMSVDSQIMAGGEVEANAEEFITMVAAGLTGATPHMISASINALSRLVFEFKGQSCLVSLAYFRKLTVTSQPDSISAQTLSELISTLAVFLTSKNREIIKSSLGFIKVATVSLPLETIEPHLPQLVPALLGWVHDHKNHFKSKTVHIFERMMRRFGVEEIIAQAPREGGERKVLEGIRRRKERAKRKKAGKTGEEDEEDQVSPSNIHTSGDEGAVMVNVLT